MRIFWTSSIIFFILFGLNIQIARAITIEEFEAQILKLQAQIAELEKQLTEIQLKSDIWCYDFLTDLKYREEGGEVRTLQIALEKEGLFKWSATGYFGPITFQSVKLFQEKYKEEILIPLKLKRGTGFFGEATRSKLNELYGCSRVQISNLKPEQGDTIIIKVKTDSPQIEGKLKSGTPPSLHPPASGPLIKFFKFKDYWLGILGISLTEKSGKYDLVIDFPEGTFLKKQLEIVERKFPTTKLLVTEELKEKGYTPEKIIKNISEENLILREILTTPSPQVHFDKPFIFPLQKIKSVGDFGVFKKSKDVITRHLGVDLEAATGTQVYAINDGLVRFSKELTNYGKILIIDHGLGIFSLYLHLNEFKVFEGQEVKQEEIIALSGDTGYSISPHLHFSIKINGLSIDPLRFIEITQRELKK